MSAVDVRVTTLVRIPLAKRGVARLAAAVVRAEKRRVAALSISFVGPARIRTLNRAHLGHDRATDVIAFTLGGPSVRPSVRPAVIADIYICPAVAAREAAGAGTGLKDELRRLVVHGVLHALGWDHPAGGGARLSSPMWRRQERLVRRHGSLAR